MSTYQQSSGDGKLGRFSPASDTGDSFDLVNDFDPARFMASSSPSLDHSRPQSHPVTVLSDQNSNSDSNKDNNMVVEVTALPTSICIDASDVTQPLSPISIEGDVSTTSSGSPNNSINCNHINNDNNTTTSTTTSDLDHTAIGNNNHALQEIRTTQPPPALLAPVPPVTSTSPLKPPSIPNASSSSPSKSDLPLVGRQRSKSGRNSIFGLTFLPLPEEASHSSTTPSTISSTIIPTIPPPPTMFRAKSRTMPEAVILTDNTDHANQPTSDTKAAGESSPSTPSSPGSPNMSPNTKKLTNIRRSVLLSHIAAAPVVGKKLQPRPIAGNIQENDELEEEEEDVMDPRKPLSPYSTSTSTSDGKYVVKDKAKRKKKKKSKHSADSNPDSHTASNSHSHERHQHPPHKLPRQYNTNSNSHNSHASNNNHNKPNKQQYHPKKQRLQDLESGLYPSDDEEDDEDNVHNIHGKHKEKGVNQDLQRIFARQRQQMPCNLYYDFLLILMTLMSIMIFLLKPLFFLLGFLWRTWQRYLLPDHSSLFDALIGGSLVVLYVIWLPILMFMTGASCGLSLCGIVYLFRRCCVPVVEEFEIDRNIHDITRRLSVVTAPLNLSHVASGGSSSGFLSSYTKKQHIHHSQHELEQEFDNKRSTGGWLPSEDTFISPYELLILPLLIAGEGILTIRV